MKLYQFECAFRGCLESYCIRGSRKAKKDPVIFVARTVGILKDLMHRAVEKHHAFKMQICIKVKLRKLDKAKTTHYFNCKQILVLQDADFEDVLMDPLYSIVNQIEEFQEVGSGWIVQRVKQMDIHITKYQPLRGSSYVELPAYIQKKHAVVNVRNTDNKCFIWAVVSALYPVTANNHRCRSYSSNLDKVNWEGLEMPMKIKDITKMEDMNKISISVYDYKDGNFAPLRISKFKYESQIDLLLHEGHYCWIKSLNRLLHDQNKHNGKHFCRCCLFPFKDKETLAKHFPECSTGNHSRITMPSDGQNYLTFQNVHRQLEAPLIMYADFECLTETISGPKQSDIVSYTRNYQQHTPCSYALLPVQRSIGSIQYGDLKLYRGKDAMEQFLNKVLELAENHHKSMNKSLNMEKNDWPAFFRAKLCHICDEFLGADRVRDHCHLTGKFRGAAHAKCNVALRLNKDVTVAIHNLRRYDGHIIMNELGNICASHPSMEINAIAKNMEDYLSFSVKLTTETGKRRQDGSSATQSYKIRFIDTCQFLPSSLDMLASSLHEDQFVSMKRNFSKMEIEKLTRKQVYPYDYMSTWKRFEETRLPQQTDFYNILTNSNLSDKDYQHASDLWNHFNIQNLGEYHDLYLTTDVLLLADVFENFRSTALKNYRLDPVHYITLPSFALDAMLKKTDENLQLLTDPDMYAFFESGTRGGISVIGHRFARANNKYLDDFDATIQSSYNMYLDVNNLYGTAMREELPYSDFEWVDESKLANLDVTKVDDCADIGYVLEVDLEYPEELHDLHDSYPLAPEKVKIENDWLSDYALEHKTSNVSVAKLVPNLMNKQKYILHYRNLKLYLEHGLKLKKIWRAIQFCQKAWMKEYIEFNTVMRQQANTNFEKDFFKLMNNAVFGKPMENVRNYRDVKLLSETKDQQKFLKLVASPRYLESKVFNNSLVAVHMGRQTVCLNKPIYAEMSILDISKTYMYRFHYEYILPKYGHESVQLLMTDTDSFIYNIKTEDIYKDMAEDADRFDFSGYPKDHPLFSDKNKKVLGKMKDETAGCPIREFVGLRAKMYSLLCYDASEMKRAKGVRKATLKNEINHGDYLQTLLHGSTSRHLMHSIRSNKHEIFSVEQNKVSLCPFDDKRYLFPDGITSCAYGHKDIHNRSFIIVNDT